MYNIHKYRQLIYSKYEVIEEFETLKAFFFKIVENNEIKLIKSLKNNNLFDKKVLVKIKKLRSSKITQIEDIYYENDMNYLKMDFFDNSKSIMNFIKTYDSNISCNELYGILHDIAISIDMLHKNNIAHFDLPYVNILINSDLQIKITDFDLSKEITPKTQEFKYIDIYAFAEMTYRIISKITHIDKIVNFKIKHSAKKLNYSSCNDFLKSLKYKCV